MSTKVENTTSSQHDAKPVLAAVKSWWNLLFKKTKVRPTVHSKYDSQYFRDLDMTFKTLKFWTPELIEWIGKENDPLKLSCTSHLLNCHEWPDYLPSKPDNYMDYTKGEEYDLRLHFCCELLRMLENKANVLCPGLSHKIWLTHFYRRSSNGG